jgi:DHA2 family multidrug resistance protein-like MFS transporter
MASSLGASFGVAISATVFTVLGESNGSMQWIEGVITYLGRQDNLAIRQAAFVALAVNLLMVAAAVASIMMTIPDRQRKGAST